MVSLWYLEFSVTHVIRQTNKTWNSLDHGGRAEFVELGSWCGQCFVWVGPGGYITWIPQKAILSGLSAPICFKDKNLNLDLCA